MDEHLSMALDDFIGQIKNSEVYKVYYEQVKKLNNYPNLQNQVNDYRRENFEIQNTYEGDELYDKTEEFFLKYEKFRENPIVSDFLASELALCRMMQEIDTRIIKGLDFQ